MAYIIVSVSYQHKCYFMNQDDQQRIEGNQRVYISIE